MLLILINLSVVDLVKDQFKLERWRVLNRLLEILIELNLSMAIKQDQEEAVVPT